MRGDNNIGAFSDKMGKGGLCQGSALSGVRADAQFIQQYEAAGRIFGITMDGLGKVRVLVPQDLLEEARKVLAG